MDFKTYQFYVSKNNKCTMEQNTISLIKNGINVTEKTNNLNQDNSGVLTHTLVKDIKENLSNILFHLTCICHDYEISIEDVANLSIEKMNKGE